MSGLFREGYIQSGKAGIHYCICGEGPWIMLLHGNMQSGKIFHRQVEYLQDKYRVVTVDSRGHGRSGYGKKRLSIDVMAKDVLRVMDALKVDETAMIGFSDGGNIALKVAAKAPERVWGLVAVGANAQASGLRSMIRIPVTAAFHILRFLRIFPPLDRLSQKMGLIIKEEPVSPEELGRIQAKTLCIMGEKDMIKESHGLQMVRQMPHSRLEVIPGGYHNLFRQMPEKINRLILDFLEGEEEAHW